MCVENESINSFTVKKVLKVTKNDFIVPKLEQ